MKKLKAIYSDFQEKMSNKRIRAVVILSMYVVFFILLLILINTGNNSSKKEINNNDNKNNIKEEIKNYENINTDYMYSAVIEIKEEDENLKYLITGKSPKYEEVSKIEKYNFENETYESSNKPTIINNDFFDLEKVINYVNNIKFEFSTEYKDGSFLKSYFVPIKYVNSSISSNDKIEVNIYQLENNITKIIINSTNLDKLINKNINSILYTIEYTNLNNWQINNNIINFI